MRTVVYTAEIDDRFGAGKVSSRIGLSSPARLYNPQTHRYLTILRAEHQQQSRFTACWWMKVAVSDA